MKEFACSYLLTILKQKLVIILPIIVTSQEIGK